MKAPIALLALMVASSCSAAGADEVGNRAGTDAGAVRSTLAKLAPNSRVERIRPSALPGVAEVVVDGQVVYVSDDGRFIFNGTLMSGVDGRDLTEVTRTELRATMLDTLPDAVKISFAPQSPVHRVTVFTAVDCGFCRTFHAQIDGYLAQGIAVDYVLIPLGAPSSPGYLTSARVHCAEDPRAAFTAATVGNDFAAPMCESPLSEGKRIADALGITTTPTILDNAGRRLGGYLSPDDLRQRLDQALAGR